MGWLKATSLTRAGGSGVPVLIGSTQILTASQARSYILWLEALKRMKRAIVLDPKRRGDEAESLSKRLGRLVVGPEEAIREIVDVLQLYQTGMHAPRRPIGHVLILGPTGCGKTRPVEATAECLVDDPQAGMKNDC